MITSCKNFLNFTFSKFITIILTSVKKNRTETNWLNFYEYTLRNLFSKKKQVFYNLDLVKTLFWLAVKLLPPFCWKCPCSSSPWELSKQAVQRRLLQECHFLAHASFHHFCCFVCFYSVLLLLSVVQTTSFLLIELR